MSPVSTKPYLIRAIYEWCVDQGFTPHLAVVVDERTVVPPGYAREGQIVLNVGPDATNSLQMGNEAITFQARFGGISHHLMIPVGNVLAVYARENGQGMAFEPESAAAENDDDDLVGDEATGEDGAGDGVGPDAGQDEGDKAATPVRGSHLKVIK